MKKIITVVILILFSVSSKAQTFSWSGFVPILDFQTDTVPIVVSGLPTAIDTNFGVAHICMNITHTYKNDLTIKMVSPAGTVVTLIQNTGGSADNFWGTCMGMDGTAFSNSQAPYTGLFIPVGNIASYNNGQNPNGTWRFIVADGANADTGSIHSVSIAFVNNPPRQSGTTSGTPPPVGTIVCPTCVCPGGASGCDLLPDMTASAKEILTNHTESPGFLYISNATPNIGAGPLDIYGIDSCFCGTNHVPCGTVCPDGSDIKHVVKQRVYQKVPGNDTLSYYDRFAGTMTYHAAHGHIHVDHWADYTLRTPTSNPDARTWPIVGTGVKQSFCLVNLGTCSGNPGECVDNNGNNLLTAPNNGIGIHTGCGLNQGIYPGSYDVYSVSLNDPIPLNGVCNGNYYIVSITDPNNVFLESDETNNWVAVPITLTQQNPAPTVTANGPTSFCPGGNVTLTSTSAANYLWSNGATTQAINVIAAGSYNVSTTCGSSVATSNIITVTIAPSTPVITAGGPTTFCPGGSVTLTSSTAGNYLWSNGATVQSIVVSVAGIYSVSTTCGSTATSPPITVTLIPLTLTASANPLSLVCNGDPVQLTSSATSVGTQNVQVTFTNTTQVPIPDNNITGVTSSIAVSGITPATLSSTSIVSVKLNLTHTYDQDLAISLISPSGNTILLSNRRGGSADNFINTIFSMSAATLISAGAAPFTGSYKPDGSFSSLTGNVNGTWLLKVQDLASIDTGRIQNWSITIKNTIAEVLSYSWSSVPSGYNSSLQNPLVNPAVTTNYIVMVNSTATGCIATKSVPVTVPGVLSISNFSPSAGSQGTTITLNGTGFIAVSQVTIAGIPVTGFTVVNDNQILAAVPNVAATTGALCLITPAGCSVCSRNSFTITISSFVNLQLKVYIDNLYSGNGLMHPLLRNINMSNDSTACDSITVELRDSIAPHSLSASSKGLLHSDGNSSVIFPSAILNHSYFIAIRHRNSLETWSKAAVLFNSIFMNYNFTSP